MEGAVKKLTELDQRKINSRLIYWACEEEKEETVAEFKSYLDKVANVDSVRDRNDSNNTLLHTAVAYGNLSLVKILLERGASVTEENDRKKTPLSMAEYAFFKEDCTRKEKEIHHLLCLKLRATQGAITDKTEGKVPGLTEASRLLRRSKDDKMRFRLKKGKFARMINEGRTAYRENPWKNSGCSTVVINRPLKDALLFELVVDKTIAKWEDLSFMIGVAASVPDDIESIESSWFMKECNWRLVFDNVWHNGTLIKSNYGINLSTVKVGDRIGFIRRSNGDLHFTFNGKEMGPAASNIPKSVYGFVDVMYYVQQISIVS